MFNLGLNVNSIASILFVLLAILLKILRRKRWKVLQNKFSVNEQLYPCHASFVPRGVAQFRTLLVLSLKTLIELPFFFHSSLPLAYHFISRKLCSKIIPFLSSPLSSKN